MKRVSIGILIVSFVLFPVCCGGGRCLAGEEAASATGTSRFQSARYLELSGNEVQAASEYLDILVSYPDEPGVVSEAYLRLKALYEKYAEKDKLRAKGLKSAARNEADPDAFFNSLKNVYTAYKNRGQYDRAISAIKYLLEFNQDPNYYLELGIIYFHGLNDAKTAIENFEMATKLNPRHSSAYTDLGLAYEMIGDYDKAVIAYKKSASLSPLGEWSLYGVKRIDAINLARKGQLVKDWFFIGPFVNAETPGKLEEQVFNDTDVRKIYAAGDRKTVAWLRPYEYDSYGYVNLSNLFYPKDFVSAYALTYIYCPKPRKVLFKVGSDDGITVWVNRKKVWTIEAMRSAAVDNDIISVELKEGWNEVILKVTQTWGSWGFYFRVTSLSGEPVRDLIFDPLKDAKRVRAIYAAAGRERFLSAARASLLYGALFFLIAALVFFTVVNMHSAMKIKRMREDFIASITHDLRIPLSSIMAFTERLMDGSVKDDKKAMEYYRTISNQAERLNRYVNKILEFSKTGKDKRPYFLKSTDIVPVLNKAIETYKYESASEGLDISLDVKGPLGPSELDEDGFTQVILNLLSNADKYSPADKRIELGVFQKGDKILVTVRDHGIGIKPKDRERIFEKFYRADDKFVGQKKGLGLGLAFVKNIVGAHGGRISVDSSPGEGSTFIIELPVAEG